MVLSYSFDQRKMRCAWEWVLRGCVCPHSLLISLWMLWNSLFWLISVGYCAFLYWYILFIHCSCYFLHIHHALYFNAGSSSWKRFLIYPPAANRKWSSSWSCTSSWIYISDICFSSWELFQGRLNNSLFVGLVVVVSYTVQVFIFITIQQTFKKKTFLFCCMCSL